MSYSHIISIHILFFDTPVAIEVRARHDSKADATLAPYCIIFWCPLADLGRSWQPGMLGCCVAGMCFQMFSESIKRRRCMTLLCQGNEVHLQATQLRWTLMQEKEAAICPAV